MASPDPDRLLALSRQLARAHQELRRRLRGIRSGADLTTHCLAFCTALTAHHRGEDAGMFTELLRERPDLAGVVAKLVEDHEMIASILSRVAELAAAARTPSGAAREAAGRELDGLAAILESHFRFEERTIGAALDDGVAAADWSDAVFRFRDGSRTAE